MNTVPSGNNAPPAPASTFDTVNSPVPNVFVTVTPTSGNGSCNDPSTTTGSAGSTTTSTAP